MHEFLPAPDDVVAMKIIGKVTGDDLTAALDRLDSVMAANSKVHLFIETQGVDGLELSAMPSYAARAMPLLGKLDRFGRVAVVADQAWVRAGTRLESAVLPNIAYRVFMPDERDEAFAWVAGGKAGPG